MTNPDNVGGLPEFVAVGEFVGYGRVTGEPHVRMSPGLRPGVRLFTEDQMRAYGELCRAAPAGSGEVDDAEALREFTEYFVKNYPGPHTVIMDPNWHAPKIFRAAKRALLRKLQQGADGVDWRAHYRFQTAMRYMDNNDKMTLDRAQRMADEDIVRMERAAMIAASQGQEGGHG